MPVKILFTPDDLVAMRARYESGDSFRDISESIGCAKNTVRSALLEFGVIPDVSRSIRTKATGRPSARKGVQWTDETMAKFMISRFGRLLAVGRTPKPRKPKKPRMSHEEKRRIESVRQTCKRFVRRVLKASGRQKSIPSAKYVGYTTAELFAHLGPRPSLDAQVDHYVPIVEFIRRGIACPSVINALVNLRWLTATENQRKGAKVPCDADDVVARCLASVYSPGLPTP